MVRYRVISGLTLGENSTKIAELHLHDEASSALLPCLESANMENLLSALGNEGWHIKNSAIETLKGSTSNYKEVMAQALNCDLCEIGEKYIQETIASSDNGILKGPYVLQVSKIRNVSAPKDNEYSSVAPRMLKLSLTDGSNTVTAIEYEQLSDISQKTPPGTKVKLVGSIVLSQGCIQLIRSSIKVLGGRVEKLYTKWKIAQDMNAISRMDIQSDSGPPPFAAFGKRTAATKRFDKSIKSLQNNTKDEENENTDFDAQRKAAIADAAHKSNDKKEALCNARDNFGQMPTGEPKAKPTGRVHHEPNQPRPEPGNIESTKSVRMYRELSTKSGEAVHQKTVNEFVSMGFKYEDVVLCLRKANNDFEEAMDLLTALPEKDSLGQQDHSHNARGRPNRSRGRGRNRGNSRSDHTEMEQGSGPATLMDFIDNRMSNMLIWNKHDQKVSQDDGNLTHESHRGGDSHRGNRRGGDSHWSNYRGNSHRDNYRGSDPHQSNYRSHDSNRGSHRGSDSHRGSYSGTESHRGNYRNGGRGSRDYNRQHDHQEYRNHRNQYNATNNAQQNYPMENSKPPQDRFNHQSYPERRQENRPQQRHSSQSFESSQSSSKVFEKQVTNKDKPKPRNKSPDFQHRKHRENEMARVEARQNPSRDYSKHDRSHMFSNVPLNPPPQRGPTTFGDPISGVSRTVNPTYNHPPQNSTSFQVNMTQSLHVTIPQWQIGSHCFAKYWEDSQYYHATITDVHPKAPTAVVQFVDFGNYEEVGLFDLKPCVTSSETSIQGTADQPYQDAGGSCTDNRHHRRHTKPPMALYVHPKHRVNQ